MNLGSALRSLHPRKFTQRDRRAVIAITIVGAIIGLLYGVVSGAIYRTTAVVSIDPSAVSLSVGTTDPAAQAVFITNFITSVTGPEAIAAASRESGIGESAIRDKISASQLGSTNAVEVSYRGRDPEKDAAIVRRAAANALSAYTASGFNRLERQVQLYRDNYSAKQNAVTNFVASTSEIDPGEHYNQVQLELIRTGNNDASLKQELDRLQPLVVGFTNLVEDRVQAGNLLQGALDRQFQLKSSADFPEASISMTTASKMSAMATIMRYVILFAAAGLLLGLAFLATRWALVQIRSNRLDAGDTLESSSATGAPTESGENGVVVAPTASGDDVVVVAPTASGDDVVLVAPTASEDDGDVVAHTASDDDVVAVGSVLSFRNHVGVGFIPWAGDNDMGDQSK